MICRFSLILAGAACGTVIAAGATPVVVASATLQALRLTDDRQLNQPTAVCVDDDGTILVVESPPRPTDPPPSGTGAWLREDIASRTPEQRLGLIKKWADKPPRPEPGPAPHLLRLSDPDGDATYEAAELTPKNPAPEGPGGAVFAQYGDVYFGSTPGWYLLPRAGKDDKDGKSRPPQTLVTGLGLRMAAIGHGTRGLTPGPDGRLYGSTGDQGLSFTAASGSSHQLANQGCVFRMEADGSGFEIFHSGLRHPCGVAFDVAGNPFTIDTGSKPGEPARLIYLVEGGDSGWRMEYQALMDWPQALGLAKATPNSWQAEALWETAALSGAAYQIPPVAHLPGLPTSVLSHPGCGWLEAEAGRLLVAGMPRGPEPGGLSSLAVVADGAGMKLADSRHLATGLAVAAAQFTWDGRLLLADAGGGRIVALDPGSQRWHAESADEAARLARENLGSWESARLAALLRHPDGRIRLRAQTAISRKPNALGVFKTAISGADPLARLHGIWGVGILARCGRGVTPANPADYAVLPDQTVQMQASAALAGLLQHKDAEVRAQALRGIAESLTLFLRPQARPVPGGQAPRAPLISADELPLGALLADPSPRVRYFAALAIGKLHATGSYGGICSLLQDNDNRDPYLRHAGAYALRHLATNPLMLTGLERHPSAAVRLGAAIALRRTGTEDAAAFINDSDPIVADESIRAVTDLDPPAARSIVAMLLDEPVARKWSPFVLRRVVICAQRAGGAENVVRLSRLVGLKHVPESLQLEILGLLKDWTSPSPVNQLTGCWSPLPDRDAAQVKPALEAALPRLLALPEPFRASIVALAETYQLPLPAAAPQPNPAAVPQPAPAAAPQPAPAAKPGP